MTKFIGTPETSEGVSTFAAQMQEKAKTAEDPIEAMVMRVASDMMAVMPKHARTHIEIDLLLRAMPNICISIVETVAATAYQGDMAKTREATALLLRRALAIYEDDTAVRCVHVRSN